MNVTAGRNQFRSAATPIPTSLIVGGQEQGFVTHTSPSLGSIIPYCTGTSCRGLLNSAAPPSVCDKAQAAIVQGKRLKEAATKKRAPNIFKRQAVASDAQDARVLLYYCTTVLEQESRAGAVKARQN